MNELNARLVKHLATNNPALATTPITKDPQIDLAILTDWATMTRRITEAQVKGVLQGSIITNPPSLTSGMEDERKALKYL